LEISSTTDVATPRITVSLRIIGGDVTPDGITQRVGVTPTYQRAAGEPRVVPSGRQYKNVRTAIWILRSSTARDETLSHKIQDLVSAINPDVASWLVTSGCVIDVFAGVFLRDEEPVGLSLSPEVLHALISRTMRFELSIYPAGQWVDSGDGYDEAVES
jgi:hypothetical protein